MSASSGPPNGIGQPVRRKEDFRLLTGRGRYGDDLALPRMVHAAFVRSPHAHARIRSMDKTAALAVPGALAVLAGADYVADGLKPIPHNAGLVEPREFSRPDGRRSPSATSKCERHRALARRDAAVSRFAPHGSD
jgi:CO/xanthine dehydrogenase Mo-binding subunit